MYPVGETELGMVTMTMRWVLLAALFGAPVLAQAPQVSPTAPMTAGTLPPGYLAGKPPVDILKLLPQPPERGPPPA